MQGSWVGIGILLIVLTVLFGWLGGVVCVLAGLMFGIVLIIVGLLNPENKKEGRNGRYCPDCGRAIPFDVNICPYCSKNFDDARKKNIVKELQKEMEKNNKVICPSCGFENKLNSKYCKKCGAKIDG